MTQVIYRQAPDENPPLPRDGREALDWLAHGNDRFATAAADGGNADRALVIDGDFGIGAVLGRRPEPRPFGIVLGCSDARVPVELVFGRAVNDLFVVRVAGNAIGGDAIGSIHYAMDHFRTLQTIVVLGHTLCGGVATAVDAFLMPRRYLELATSLALRALVDRIAVSARVAAMALQGEHGNDIAKAPGYGWAVLDLAVYLNAAYVAFSIDAGLSAAARSRMTVAYGVYDVTTRRVSAGPDASSAFEAPPAGAEGFRTLARALASAPHIVELLHGRRSPAGYEPMAATAHTERHA